MVISHHEVENRERLVTVTGAGRGIGLATTQQLLAEGYWVHAIDIFAGAPHLTEATKSNGPASSDISVDLGYPLADQAALRNLKLDFPKTLSISQCDVRDPGGLGLAIAQVEELTGLRTGAAIACAGVVTGISNVETTLDSSLERLTVEVNLYGVMNLARVTLSSIRESSLSTQWGRFIAISSVAGLKALPQMSAYVASKHAVEGFVHTLAIELRGTSVTVNTIAPGSTRGVILDRSAAIYGIESAESFAHQHLTARLIEPQEIANVVSFLLSDQARSITGSTIMVDGGLHLT
ncbi:MAG: SDR family oxidoreductase [Acidimicrobiales bacterium]